VLNPWLTAYDVEGRPIWELLAANVEGTTTGWVTKEVVVRFYDATGTITVEAKVAEIHTDPKGNRWETAAPLEGKGEDFHFGAQEARWQNGELQLKGLTFVSGKLNLQARVATWDQGGIWRLAGVEASFGDWEFEFPEGIYRQDQGVLEITKGLVARGWDWEVRAEGAVVDVAKNKVTLRGVEVVKA